MIQIGLVGPEDSVRHMESVIKDYPEFNGHA